MPQEGNSYFAWGAIAYALSATLSRVVALCRTLHETQVHSDRYLGANRARHHQQRLHPQWPATWCNLSYNSHRAFAAQHSVLQRHTILHLRQSVYAKTFSTDRIAKEQPNMQPYSPYRLTASHRTVEHSQDALPAFPATATIYFQSYRIYRFCAFPDFATRPARLLSTAYSELFQTLTQCYIPPTACERQVRRSEDIFYTTKRSA